MRWWQALALLLALGPLPALAASDVAHGCRVALRTIDQAVDAAGVRDAEAHRVPGFPYLRATRFLASFDGQVADRPAFADWMRAMASLDAQARGFELQNLGGGRAALVADLARRLGPGWTPDYVLANCPAILQGRDIADSGARSRLTEMVEVPDAYSIAARTLGLYPVSAIPIAAGWERWKTENLPAFQRPFDEKGLAAHQIAWHPGRAELSRQQASALIRRAPVDALGVPRLDPNALARVAAAFAPVFLIETRSNDDWIGHPMWREAGLPTVDPKRPVAFVRQSHARLDGRPVLQLVTTIWFAGRPKAAALDLLGGRLDGLIWRITFDPEGRPFVYDTIHACGCYHLFFPAPGVERLPVMEDRADDLREAPTTPRKVPSLEAGERLAIRLASGSHYVTGLAGEKDIGQDVPAATYRLIVPEVPDAPLRAMPLPDGGSLSLFGPDGLVLGSERLERYLLWPMGIAEPGAMRQWGHHATAFVGHRHFDDPGLFDGTFAR